MAISLPDQALFDHFPESAVLSVLDASLAAAELALSTEHLAAEDVPLDPEHYVAQGLLLAHLLLTRTRELRDLLELYSAATRRAIHFGAVPDDDLF